MSAVTQLKPVDDFVVADLKLADWGRKEIRIAETEMPGLMAIREEFASQQPPGQIRDEAVIAGSVGVDPVGRRAIRTG